MTSIGFCLICLKVTTFSLGPTLLLHNFRWFIIRAPMAHHPLIQEEVDEILGKDDNEV